MKWAPNKKLHFEVAVIKAIQTLNQVTLNEVIENLTALRDGKPVAGGGDAGVPKAKVEMVAASPESVRGGYSESLNVDEIWHKLSAKIPAQKRFLKSLIESTRALDAEGRTFLIGYAPERKSVIETLATDNNRRFLESLLKEISGRDWTVKFVVKEGLPVSPVANEMQQSAAESFKDDPLIQEALEIFKGEIKT